VYSSGCFSAVKKYIVTVQYTYLVQEGTSIPYTIDENITTAKRSGLSPLALASFTKQHGPTITKPTYFIMAS
jgi:hypothetical protein